MIAAEHLIWIIVAAGALAALASFGLQPLEGRKAQAAAQPGSGALLRNRGFLAIIAASALIQGSHSTYYVFGSITWQLAGLGGLTIAALWALGVVAEIVVFALSPRFTLRPSMLVVIGGVGAMLRWLITAQEPPVAVLAVVQLAHGVSFGLTQVGIMGLMVRHVPMPVVTRAQGYLAACGGIVASTASIVSGAIYARYGQGAYYAMAAMALSGAAVMWLARRRLARLIPRARRPADRRDCRHSAGRRRGRASATAGRRDRQSGPVAPAAWPAPSQATSPPCSRP